MILNIHGDASYLSECEAKIRAGCFFYIRSNIDSPNRLNNGAFLIISTILKHVMSSVAEAEIGPIFSTQKKQQFYRPHWKKWDIHIHPHHYKLTTQHQHDT
jgi:hypothetical protein